MKIPKIYVITLRQTPEREMLIRNRLVELEIKNYEIFYGVHGNSFGLKAKDLYEPEEKYLRVPFTDGQIGCYLSHYILWNVIQHSNETECVVMEDDVTLSDDFKDKYLESAKNLPDDFDVWAFGNYFFDKSSSTHIKGNVYKSGVFDCTHGYLLNKKCVSYILKEMSVIKEPVDIQLKRLVYPNLNVYISHPTLVKQKSLENDEKFKSMTYNWELDVHDFGKLK